MKALLLHADGTQALPIAKSLASEGYIVSGIFCNKANYGYASKFIDKKYIFKGNMKDFKGYFFLIESILKAVHYDIIIPLNDESSEVLSIYREELLQYTSFKMPEHSVFVKGYDKHQLMKSCRDINVPIPKTYYMDEMTIDEVCADKSVLYPVIIKPNITCGARGMTIVNDAEELAVVYPNIYKQFGECHIQEYIPAGGKQVEVQLYIDENQELLASSVIKKHRWYPERGGSSCCNVSCVNSKIVDECYKVLKHVGWVGFADFDTIEDPRTGELLIMEINPRVPACVKTPITAGIDWGKIIANNYLGNRYSVMNVPIKDVTLRHLGFEVLWFIKSKNRFKTKPFWFDFLGKNIYYQDISHWSDPLPFFYGTLGNIFNLLNPSFRKAKYGK